MNRRPDRPEGDWSARPFFRPLSDFEGLQDTYNNVEYYGSRALLRYQPTERWDLLANVHWGENRSDSFHLQSVGTFPGRARADDFIEEPQGFSEASYKSRPSRIALLASGQSTTGSPRRSAFFASQPMSP